MTDDAIREHFRLQARACDGLGSPFTARLCRALADGLDRGTPVGRRVLDWPGNPAADALALRLCGGLHALVLAAVDAPLAAVYPPGVVADGALAAAVPGAIARHDAWLQPWLDGPPQTNEIARSAMLLPGFLTIARETGRPLALNEIGASAGLNLLWDRFRYRYGEAEWGDPASPVLLAPDVDGMPPPLAGTVVVAGRAAADVAPVDVRDPAARLRLRAYVWPDQAARLDRLAAALTVAAAQPVTVEKADAADFVARRLAARQPGTAFVLYHSIVWQYLPEATRQAIEAAMAKAGRMATAESPLAWLRMEPAAVGAPFATLSLTLWPGGSTRALARADYHGRRIGWDGAAGAPG